MDTEELIHRIKSALIILTEGHSFKVGDLKTKVFFQLRVGQQAII